MHADRSERRAAMVAMTLATLVLGFLQTAGAVEQRVEWTNQANVTLRGGNALQKTGGCMGCDDAGAVSRQMIRSGNGYVEFTVAEPYTFWMAGLSESDGNTQFNSIDFAFRFNGNDTADVLENGRYQGGDTDYAAGDRFRVVVADGRVEYLKNGRVVFESRQRPRYPLVLIVALGTSGATIGNARIDTSNRAFTDDAYYNEADRISGRASFYHMDRNGDGVIARREWVGAGRVFNLFDANGDRVLTLREYTGTVRGGRAIGTSGQLITVNPTERWTDTGMRVEAGDLIVFDAEGSIQLSDSAGDTATPAGSRSGRRAIDAPLRTLPAGMLLARIGNSEAVAIGGQRTIRFPVSGELYLGVNDDFLDDNSGEYRVIINIYPQ
jgi:hypothetical protein